MTKQLPEIREALTELVDVYRVSKPLCAGHFLLYAFTKKPTEFRTVSQLIMDLAKETLLSQGDTEEA